MYRCRSRATYAHDVVVTITFVSHYYCLALTQHAQPVVYGDHDQAPVAGQHRAVVRVAGIPLVRLAVYEHEHGLQWYFLRTPKVHCNVKTKKNKVNPTYNTVNGRVSDGRIAGT